MLRNHLTLRKAAVTLMIGMSIQYCTDIMHVCPYNMYVFTIFRETVCLRRTCLFTSSKIVSSIHPYHDYSSGEFAKPFIINAGTLILVSSFKLKEWV